MAFPPQNYLFKKIVTVCLKNKSDVFFKYLWLQRTFPVLRLKLKSNQIEFRSVSWLLLCNPSHIGLCIWIYPELEFLLNYKDSLWGDLRTILIDLFYRYFDLIFLQLKSKEFKVFFLIWNIIFQLTEDEVLQQICSSLQHGGQLLSFILAQLSHVLVSCWILPVRK